MPKFIAVSSKGLMDVLYDELQNLGLSPSKKTASGVEFESNWKGCYEANLRLRSATRILKPILDFKAYSKEDLYHNTKKHNFTKYITCDQTLSVDSNISQGKIFSQRALALIVKDAVVDQFREEFAKRPSVAKENPDLKIVARASGPSISLAIDTSGNNLSQRGYRQALSGAPMREHLAAGLMMMTKWDGTKPLVDPMCGSGTLLIEAVLMAKSYFPRSLDRQYAFENFKIFNELVFSEIKKENPSDSQKLPLILGFDKNPSAIVAANSNAKRAGVSDFVRFKVSDFRRLEEFKEKGVLVVNPPYGGRLQSIEDLQGLYKDFGAQIKKSFSGWDCWILSGEGELTKHLGLKAFQKIPVNNGNITCRFLGYSIR